MGYGYKPKFGLTGGMAERELFGEVGQKINIDFKKWQQEQDALYLPRELAIKQAQENQTGENPHIPEPKFASDLFEKVVDIFLRRSNGDQSVDEYNNIVDRVKFFTAVNSPLDYAHGIDAMFEIDLNGKPILVTLDASKRHKIKLKADILVQYPSEGLDPKEDKKEWDELVALTADSIINQYDNNLKEHGRLR